MTDTCLLSDTCINGCSSYAKERTARLDAAKCAFRSIPSNSCVTSSMKRQKSAALSNKESYTCAEGNYEKTCFEKSDDDADEDQKEWWSKTTNDLVQLSTFPFLFLSLPQVRTNAIHLRSGNLAALSVLSWKGFLTALAANSILMSYFFKKREFGAAVVQTIGVMSNFILLVQIYMAGLLDGATLTGVAVFILVSAFVNGTVALGTSRSWKWMRVSWINRLWETCLSVLGLSLLIHALWSTLFPKTNLVPAYVTAVLSLTIDVLHWMDALSPTQKKAWNGISAWTATLLFAFQPIGQLVCNFANPSSLAGLSLNFSLLAMAGNGLMVPRALHTRDKIWLTGTLWGSSMMGWAQLLCLYVAGLQTGSCYLSATLFYLLSIGVVLYFFFIFTMEAKASNLSHPLEALFHTYFSH